MKNDVMTPIVQVDPEVLQALMAEVKETVANYFQVPAEKQTSFSRVNMWNIRRNAKSASTRVRR